MASRTDVLIEGQKRALELAVHGAPLHEVLEALVRTIETHSSNAVKGSILLLDEDRAHLRHGAAPSLPAAYCEAIDGIEIGPAVGSCGTAAYTGRTVVVTDIATDPLWAAFKDLALRHELHACWSMPIFSTRGEVLGTFALYHAIPTAPSDDDRNLVEVLGHTAGIVIERDRNARQREEAQALLRKEAERQLARVLTLFELAPTGIAVLRGPDHVFELANQAYATLVGGRSVVGLPLLRALPELEGQGFDKLLDDVRASGKPYVGHAQRVLLAREGRTDEVFVDFVYQPVPGPDGNSDGILVVAYDVTELVRARQRAESSEQELRTFIDNLPALAWTARPDGHIDYYNQGWFAYTGTTFEEMQGWGWERVHDPALLPSVRERWGRSLASGEPFEMEFTLRGADGIARWFLTRITPMRDAKGTIVRWFGTNTNIHDIKAAQALSAAMAEQSLDVQKVILQLRQDKERAEQRVRELETPTR